MGYEVVNPKTGNTGFEPISLGSEPSVLAVILIAYAATSAIPETARGFCLYTAQIPVLVEKNGAHSAVNTAKGNRTQIAAVKVLCLNHLAIAA